MTNHHLIAYSLSNISAKNYQNRLMCVEVIVCYIIVVFLRHSVEPGRGSLTLTGVREILVEHIDNLRVTTNRRTYSNGSLTPDAVDALRCRASCCIILTAVCRNMLLRRNIPQHAANVNACATPHRNAAHTL